MPNRGKAVDAIASIMDRKTKGPFIIALAYQYICLPIISIIPILPSIEPALLFIQQPKLI